MNFENICRLYSADKSISFSQKPPFIRAFYAIDGEKKYAVRWNCYKSTGSFTGITSGADFFILRGKSKITIDGKTYNLDAGNLYEIPKCEYEHSVTGTESFEYIVVYQFPNDFSIPDLK